MFFCPFRPAAKTASCTTFSGSAVLFRTRSLPMRSMPTMSCMRNGPTLKPKFSAATSISQGRRPFWTRRPLPETPITRLATKPGQFPTRQVTFLIFVPKAIEVAIVRGLDLAPLMFSSSRITFAGEKKWQPTTSCGRFVADAISLTSRALVFEARTQPGLQTLSSSAKIFFLRPMFSKTASTMMSQCARAAYCVDGEMLAR
mmetsp:Transcript_111058/g.314314  ORF Transcript_111058/g.314314 Transcript_111058/m.314314 type:complete len:201 (-) Transcript_111058:1150-1752(-)